MEKQYNNKIQKFIIRYNNLTCLFISNINNYCSEFAAFANSCPYARLMHLHQPIDIQLLIIPILWVLAVACSNVIQFLLLSLIFTVGIIAMYGVRKIINNIVNGNFDKEVGRAKDNLITNNELSIVQARKLLVLLLGILIAVLSFLPVKAIYFGVFTIGLVVVYPFIKKYSHFSQALLSFVSNSGIFIAWFTAHKYFSFTPLLIYLAAVLWVIGCDVIYVYQDKKDGIKIGIPSIPIISRNKPKEIVRYLYRISIFLLGITGLNANLNLMFFPLLALGLYELNKQIDKLDLSSHKNGYNRFKNNLDYGLLILLAFVIGRF